MSVRLGTRFFYIIIILMVLGLTASAENVTLTYPADAESCVPGTSLNLTYTVADASVTTCHLYSNHTGTWALTDSNYTVSSAANNRNYFSETLNPGTIGWGVTCTNATTGIWASSNFTFTLKNVPYCATLTEVSCNSNPNIGSVSVFRARLKNTKGFSLEHQDCNVYITNVNDIPVKAYNTMLVGQETQIQLDKDGNWINTGEHKVPLTDSSGYYVFPFIVDPEWAYYQDNYTIHAVCNGVEATCAFQADKTALPDMNNMEAFGREAGGIIVLAVIGLYVLARYGGVLWRQAVGG